MLIAPAVFLTGAEIARIRGFGRPLLLAVLGTIGVGMWRVTRSRLPRQKAFLRGVGVTALAFAAIALTPLALGAPNFTSIEQAVLPVMAMIAATLWLRWDDALSIAEPAKPRADSSRAWLYLAVVVFVALVTVANRVLVGDFPEVTDEASYMLQAQWMRMPGFSWHIDPSLKDFFTERHLIDRPGQLAVLYPPGWPAVLGLFDAVGLRAEWGVFVGSLTLLCTYRISVLLHDRRVATLAVVLLVSSQWFLSLHASYMSHGVTMMFAAAAVVAMLEADRRAAGPRLAHWAAAGALLSLAVASRPLTGAALGSGLVLWVWMRNPMPLSDRMRTAVCLLAGALPGLAFLLYYNASTTGSPLVFGYNAVYGSLQNPGFGLRGWRVYDETLARVPVVEEFTPLRAVMQFAITLANAALTWLPVFALGPILLAARHLGIRWQARSWWPILLLPGAYFLYFFRDLRFWSEALPYFAMGVAWLLIGIRDRAPALGAQLIAIMLAGQITLLVPGRGVAPYGNRPWRAYMPATAARINFQAIERLKAEHGKLLIFAREPGPGFAPLRDRLMVYNGEGEAGDVLVARDLGDRNAELMRRYPDRTAFLFIRETSAGSIPATITPLGPPHSGR
jgi:hypothetical protein